MSDNLNEMKGNLVSFPYGRTESRELIHVDDARKGHRYLCPVCGAVVIPRQGQQRAWHFAHKPSVNRQCSLESYLHVVGKQLIASFFKEKLENGDPVYARVRSMVEVQVEPGKVVDAGYDDNRFGHINLLRGKSRVEIEAPVGDLRPDVAVSGSGDTLFVEICVSSPVSARKKAGASILEIDLRSLDDLDLLTTPPFIESDTIRFYGIDHLRPRVRDRASNDLHAACRRIASAFETNTPVVYRFVEVVTAVSFAGSTLKAAVKKERSIDLRRAYEKPVIEIQNLSPNLKMTRRTTGHVLRMVDAESNLETSADEDKLAIDMRSMAASMTFGRPIEVNDYLNAPELKAVDRTIYESDGSKEVFCHGFRPAGHWSSSRFWISLADLIAAIQKQQVELISIEDIGP